MDLPDLLEPERIRCRCDIHSKKRALQTVAELLGASLRAGAAPTPGDGESAREAGVGGTERSGTDGSGAAEDDDGAGPTGERASTAAKERVRRGDKRRRSERGREESDADALPDISDMDILDALISRERLGSTGLGHGVALPHSRIDLLESPLAAMITLNDGVDFESVDGEPVDLVVGLLVPRDCNDEHLEILANLARRFGDAEFREKLRGADSAQALFDELRGSLPAP